MTNDITLDSENIKLAIAMFLYLKLKAKKTKPMVQINKPMKKVDQLLLNDQFLKKISPTVKTNPPIKTNTNPRLIQPY